MANIIKNHKILKVTILLIFISMYVFFLCMAFNIAFTPCETKHIEYEIFCFASPLILPTLVGVYLYHLFLNKRGNPFLSSSKALLLTIVILSICLSFAIFFTNIIEIYLENKYVDTEIYDDYFVLKCGYDDYQLKDFLFSLLMSIGTFIGGLLFYSLIILINKKSFN